MTHFKAFKNQEIVDCIDDAPQDDYENYYWLLVNGGLAAEKLNQKIWQRLQDPSFVFLT